MSNKILRTKRGFTLVEMLVATSIFMVVMIVAVGALVSIINANRQGQDIQTTVNNVEFALDDISRNVRVGTNYECATPTTSFTASCPQGGSIFMYQQSDGDYQQYQFVSTSSVTSGMGDIQVRTCGTDPSTCASYTWQSLTAPAQQVAIASTTFYVLATSTGSTPYIAQPRLIITVDGIIQDSNGSEITNFTLQTTASQRSRQSY